MYKFRSYLLQEIDRGYVLQNGISTVVITNEKLINFLNKIEELGIEEADEELFFKSFGDECTSVIRFLKENKVIKEIKVPNLRFNKIHLFTNDNKFSRLFNYCIEDFGENIINISLENYKSVIDELDEMSLCIIFFNPFNLKQYIEICDELSSTNAIIRTSFFYNHSIYISNLYRKEWYNPCPKCFFYALETQLRASTYNNSINFQTIIDLIYKENVNFKITTNLKNLDIFNFITLLLKDIKFKDKFNNINSVYEFDIESYKVVEDSSYHWELCDCYE